MWLRTREGCTLIGWTSSMVSALMPCFSKSCLISSVSARMDTASEREEQAFLSAPIWQIYTSCLVETRAVKPLKISMDLGHALSVSQGGSPCTTTSSFGTVEKRLLRGSISPGARNPWKNHKGHSVIPLYSAITIDWYRTRSGREM